MTSHSEEINAQRSEEKRQTEVKHNFYLIETCVCAFVELFNGKLLYCIKAYYSTLLEQMLYNPLCSQDRVDWRGLKAVNHILSLYNKSVLSPVEFPVSLTELNVCLLSSFCQVFKLLKESQSSHQDVCYYLGDSAAPCHMQQY